MKLSKLQIAALVLTMACLMLPVTASAANGGVLSVPITLQGTPTGGTPIAIPATFNITSFAVQNGKVVANGTVNFAFNGLNQAVQTALPITQASGSCPVLSLTLGPLHLDLLGLVVDLNQINLNITAQSGP